MTRARAFAAVCVLLLAALIFNTVQGCANRQEIVDNAASAHAADELRLAAIDKLVAQNTRRGVSNREALCRLKYAILTHDDQVRELVSDPAGAVYSPVFVRTLDANRKLLRGIPSGQKCVVPAPGRRGSAQEFAAVAAPPALLTPREARVAAAGGFSVVAPSPGPVTKRSGGGTVSSSGSPAGHPTAAQPLPPPVSVSPAPTPLPEPQVPALPLPCLPIICK